MTSPTKDSFTDHHHGNKPITGYGSSSSPADPTQVPRETRTPTTTEVEPSQSQTPPLLSPTPPFSPPSPPSIHPATSSVGSSSGRKRGRPRKEYRGGDGESSSTPHKLLRGDRERAPCIICGREFSSDKAYFGHLRKHPDRQWRGAYPPGEFRKLGPTLLELANQTIARMSGRGPRSGSYNSSRGSLGINLNNPSNSPSPPPPSRRADGGALHLDLNMPPPPEHGEEEVEEEEEDPDHHPSHSDI